MNSCRAPFNDCAPPTLTDYASAAGHAAVNGGTAGMMLGTGAVMLLSAAGLATVTAVAAPIVVGAIMVGGGAVAATTYRDKMAQYARQRRSAGHGLGS